jgi:hypothetical protein
MEQPGHFHDSAASPWGIGTLWLGRPVRLRFSLYPEVEQNNCGPSQDSNTELPEVLGVRQSAYRAHSPLFVTTVCTTTGVCSSIILNHSKCQLTCGSTWNITFILWVIRQILTKRVISFVLYESSINVVGTDMAIDRRNFGYRLATECLFPSATSALYTVS